MYPLKNHKLNYYRYYSKESMPQVTFIKFQGIYTNINRILSEAGELIKGGHYAAAHVRGVAARLDKAWKEFAGGLDERTTVLALSVMFHQKAEQVNTMQIIGDIKKYK